MSEPAQIAPERPRPLRADAERNRRRLVEAAAEVFAERGVDASVSEIAKRAGVGQGTVFRRFPSKEALIAAILVDRLDALVAHGRELLEHDGDPERALVGFLETMLHEQTSNRGLAEAFALVRDDPDLIAAQEQLIELINELVCRAQQAGKVRSDVGAVDVLLMMKGICEAAMPFDRLNADVARRLFDLTLASLAPHPSEPLQGTALTLEQLRAAHTCE